MVKEETKKEVYAALNKLGDAIQAAIVEAHSTNNATQREKLKSAREHIAAIYFEVVEAFK